VTESSFIQPPEEGATLEGVKVSYVHEQTATTTDLDMGDAQVKEIAQDPQQRLARMQQTWKRPDGSTFTVDVFNTL